MSRGFIFTTDSLLAIIVCVFIAVSSLALSAKFSEPVDRARPLAEAGRDFMAALEKNGTLGQAAVSGNTAGITDALDGLPFTYCASIQLLENGTEMAQVNRTGCSCDVEIVTAYRTFLARNGSSEKEMSARFGGCLD